MDTQVLEDIGLTNIEIKVFIKILELGECKSGKIIEKSNLQSSSVYNAVNSLINKGLVSYIKKSQIKYYKAADPEVILDYIDLKKQEYLKLLPELKIKQNKRENEGVEFFKSYKGIKSLVFEVLKGAKKGDVYKSFAVGEKEAYVTASDKVFGITKSLLKECKIVPKLIAHESTRKPKEADSIFKKRYINFPMPPNTLIFNDKVGIISWKGEPSGILIHSKDIAESYSNFFDHIWKLAKKS